MFRTDPKVICAQSWRLLHTPHLGRAGRVSAVYFLFVVLFLRGGICSARRLLYLLPFTAQKYLI